jgi:hypothetical protein
VVATFALLQAFLAPLLLTQLAAQFLILALLLVQLLLTLTSSPCLEGRGIPHFTMGVINS